MSEIYDIRNQVELVAMQPGDVEITFADVSKMEREYGYSPQTSLREGLRKVVEWYKTFYLK